MPIISHDDMSYNVWDGLPDDSHLNLHDSKDHLGRTLMNTKDRDEWTSQL